MLNCGCKNIILLESTQELKEKAIMIGMHLNHCRSKDETDRTDRTYYHLVNGINTNELSLFITIYRYFSRKLCTDGLIM